ncbi:hypothetical protein LHYA1_G004932 [Lachnellula hyalina]|uniref:Uncharacterized protein n=1 Tax=Lachnellula hyalina TaxID=1316788 RepID=A0A8H8R1A9_9HELO|nr:uncharacterized protein LHYA1_G004932 [Lachnellula hyalina]TVY26251.1 hypothetical protein LHYA1_G004932 [Lachnellula hyalina]
MADLENDSTIIVDDEQPLAVRRKRRSSTRLSLNTQSASNPQNRGKLQVVLGNFTPPATPKRAKKRVRFSDPGPILLDSESESASASGLTPFIRRTSLSTPASKRRHSTPAVLSNRSEYNAAPISGTLQFAPLRQVLEGRVKRRLRRNRLSEEINTIEWDKKKEEKKRRTEVGRLREELAAKDFEVQSIRDELDIASQLEGESGISATSNSTQSTKIQELEQVIVDLKAELQRKDSEPAEDTDWTMAAQDPFDFDDDDNMITNYDDDFHDNTEMETTPTRLNTSFPSPPSTMPSTPCKSVSSGIQACLPIPDPEKDALKIQLESLNSEVSKLTSTIAFKDDNQSRLTEKLSQFIPIDESHDHTSIDVALDSVLTQLAIAQSHALEKENAFSALTVEITGLGFSSSGPEETLELIATQFRQARLDLEYLTPGEVVEGFENDKLLDMLVSRTKVLLEKVKVQDASIDEYHSQEISLRQQLNTRVNVTDGLQKELYLANTVVGALREEMEEKEVSNQRLQSALEGYRAEVTGLENLIERVEKEGRNNEAQFRGQVNDMQEKLQHEILKHDTTRACEEGKDMIIMELERRLTAALESASAVQSQLSALSTTKDTEISNRDSMIEQLQSSGLEREREHGDALALRDARVSELREEVERVNNALKTAHATILELRNQNRELNAQVSGEKTRGLLVVQAMRDQLTRALETGLGYVNGDVSVQGPEPSCESSSPVAEESSRSVVRSGGFFDGELARKSGKKRRRYDSGLGFLEEEGDEEMVVDV